MQQLTSPYKSLPLKTIMLCVGGNIIEWFEFIIFGLVINEMSDAFFHGFDIYLQKIFLFTVFSFGLFIRPLGALIFGYIGDKYGKKKSYIISIYAIMISSLLMAILPSSRDMGIIAPILLSILRIVQGLCIGGAFAGSMVILHENADHSNRGLTCSFAPFSAVIGVILASFVVIGLHSVLSCEAYKIYGWRLAFLMNIILGLFVIIARNNSRDETVQQNKDDNFTFGNFLNFIAGIFKNNFPNILLIVTIENLLGIGFFIIVVLLPTYFNINLELPFADTKYFHLFLMFIFAVSTLLGGMMIDYLGSIKKVLLITTFSSAVLSVPIFIYFANGYLFVPGITLVIINGVFFGSVPSLLNRFFPKENMFTCVAITHNIAMSIFGSIATPVSTYYIKYNTMALGYIFLLSTILSMIGILALSKYHQDKSW